MERFFIDIDFIKKMDFSVSQGIFWFYLREKENNFQKTILIENNMPETYLELDMKNSFDSFKSICNKKDTIYRWILDFYKKGLVRLIQKKNKYYLRFISASENDYLAPKEMRTNLYLMFDEISGYYKIGRSINPSIREKTLLSQAPKIKILFSFESNCRKEKELHHLFSKQRIRGEWFNLNEKDIQYIKQVGGVE